MPSSFRTFHAASDALLPAALRTLLPEQSWSQIKQLVRQRRVQINGNLCLDEGRKIKAGDVIRISDQSLAPPVTAKDVRIVHVDEQVVVVDKPPGVTTLRHSQETGWSDRRKQKQPTLDELVAKLLNAPVRAVHRLDRDTSGLMVFARTADAEIHLIRQFKKHSVDRAYIAIAHGEVDEQSIETHLVRDRGDGLRGSSGDPHAESAERAVTHIRPLETLTGYTVVECRLETGRTHQIRIHLAERGHTLCGEKTYNRALGSSPMEDRSCAERQALHAAVLGFEHPASGQRLQFVSPLPQDMVKLLERLRKKNLGE